MLQESIEQFKMLVSLQMPNLVSPTMLEDIEMCDDYAILTFQLPKTFGMESLIDELEDQMELILLYHMVPSKDTPFGQSCCAYSNPRFGHMFKMNSISDEWGNCNVLYVTVYSSLEYMGDELRKELARVSSKGQFIYHRQETELLLDFF